MTEKLKFGKILEFIQKNSVALALLPIILLVVGFFIWDIYLYMLGFLEYEILRAKFIISGLIFFLIAFALLQFTLWVFKFKTLDKPLFKFIRIPILLIWIFFYSIFIHPMIPSFLGGGQPRALSLITSKETMVALNSLDIKNGEGGQYQTENLCVVHENSKGIYILKENRILMLDKSLFEGLVSLPGIKKFIELDCNRLARNWLYTGLISQLPVPFLKHYFIK